jgi:hypothetical protein
MTSVQSNERGALAELLWLVEGSPRSERPVPARARVLARHVWAWIADPEQGVAATGEALDGADATRRALASLAPSALTLAACVAAEPTCWAEVTRRGSGDPETWIIGLTLDGSGLVCRLILLRAALVPPATAGESTSAPLGRPILEAYFDDLMNSRFHEAAAHFSADALYSHPPYAGGSARVLFTGREALRRGFAIERGPSPARQVITGLWQSRERVFIEGVVEGIPDGGSFFSTAQISPQGQIARYVAFYSTRGYRA